jgi:ribosome-binding factor A
MPQGSRPDRVGEEIRHEIGELLVRELQDPGLGFLTLTRVKVTPDLQLARIYYTQMGDEAARRETRRALERALPFLRRALGKRLRLRRVPALSFHFDESIANQERIERLLLDLEAERQARATPTDDAGEPPADAADAAENTDGLAPSDDEPDRRGR